jgi:urease accessory protein
MLIINELLSEFSKPHLHLTLDFEHRQKSRLRTQLDDGTDVLLSLPRGSVLRQGDLLRAVDGTVVQVEAALEAVSVACSQNMHQLARACYHLGNRHVPVQIGDHWLRYQPDHVLADLLRGLGLEIHEERAPFEPETGAYHGRNPPAPPHDHAH